MFFQYISKDDEKDLIELTFDPEIMKHIRQGKVWDQKKVQSFIDDCLEDKLNSIKERSYINFKIVDKEKFIGLLMLKKMKGEWYLTIMIKRNFQNQGYFSKTLMELRKLMNEYFPRVEKMIVETHTSNRVMVYILDKKMVFHQDKKIGKITVRQYYFYLRPYTYMLKTEYSDPVELEAILNKQGWRRGHKNPDFLYVEGRYQYDKRLYSVVPYLKNLSNENKRVFTNKENLYRQLKNKGYMMKSYSLDLDKQPFTQLKNKVDNKVWILKPSEGWAGKGIKMIVAEKDLEKLNPDDRYRKWVMQEYITKPYLFQKKKFHLRCLFMLRDNGEGYIFKYMPVYLAKEEYSIDYRNLEEHISHYDPEQKAIYFPTSFKLKPEQTTYIMAQIIIIFKDVMQLTDLACYPKIERCYEIFGADLMLTDELEVKLIEINEKIGLKEFRDGKIKFNELLFKGQIMRVVNDIFPSHFELTDDFIKI